MAKALYILLNLVYSTELYLLSSPAVAVTAAALNLKELRAAAEREVFL